MATSKDYLTQKNPGLESMLLGQPKNRKRQLRRWFYRHSAKERSNLSINSSEGYMVEPFEGGMNFVFADGSTGSLKVVKKDGAFLAALDRDLRMIVGLAKVAYLIENAVKPNGTLFGIYDNTIKIITQYCAQIDTAAGTNEGGISEGSPPWYHLRYNKTGTIAMIRDSPLEGHKLRGADICSVLGSSYTKVADGFYPPGIVLEEKMDPLYKEFERFVETLLRP